MSYLCTVNKLRLEITTLTDIPIDACTILISKKKNRILKTSHVANMNEKNCYIYLFAYSNVKQRKPLSKEYDFATFSFR